MKPISGRKRITPGHVCYALLMAAAFVLSGCGASHYRSDYTGFNTAFADSSNRQMLMNLARLDQHDPAYFLQFGQISVQYQVNGSASIVGNDAIPSGAHVPIVNGTATLAGGANTTPQFTFIPVADDKVAQQLLLPLPPEDFYTLFQQGLPVDQLLRLMAERFEIRLPSGGGLTTYSNTPGRCQELSYIVFLKICAIARELQLAGNLKLRASEVDEQVTKNWVWTPSDKDDDPASNKPSAQDVMDARAKGMFYKLDRDKGTWSLYKHVETASFYLEGDSTAAFRKLAADPLTSQGETLRNVRDILTSKDGFSIQGDVLAQTSAGSRLILRSFMSALTAAAEEQTYFDATNNTAFRQNVPTRELRPILRLKWSGNEKLQPELLSLNYRGQNYTVTDPVTAPGGDESLVTWNRDVFRLLTQLAGQASIDTSKFPLPTSLQLLPSP